MRCKPSRNTLLSEATASLWNLRLTLYNYNLRTLRGRSYLKLYTWLWTRPAEESGANGHVLAIKVTKEPILTFRIQIISEILHRVIIYVFCWSYAQSAKFYLAKRLTSIWIKWSNERGSSEGSTSHCNKGLRTSTEYRRGWRRKTWHPLLPSFLSWWGHGREGEDRLDSARITPTVHFAKVIDPWSSATSYSSQRW